MAGLTSRSVLLLAAALAAGTLLAACGGNDDSPATPTTAAKTTTPAPLVQPGVNRAAVTVVRNWADTLRRGDVTAAARYFAVPSRIANGGPPRRLTSSALILAFNATLPCGARLVRADRAREGFIVATFVLTERPGAGTCGTGVGKTARTAFRVRDGRITDWLRVEDLPEAEVTPA